MDAPQRNTQKKFDPDFFKDNTKKAMNIEGMFYLIAWQQCIFLDVFSLIMIIKINKSQHSYFTKNIENFK